MALDDIPLSLSDVSADYLTEALKEAGVLGTGRVSRFDSRVIGEGAGFMGEVVDLEVHFSPEHKQGPTSFILKIPTASRNREVGQTLGVYEREIRFYRELQPHMNIRTPQHFFSAMDISRDPETGLKAIKVLNRMPLWLIRAMLPLLNWANGRATWHYILLIEHLKAFRIGDQVAGCSIDETRRVLTTMADMHGQFWNSERLDEFRWLVPMRYAGKPMHMMYVQAVDKFKERHAERLTGHASDILDWMKANFLALFTELSARPSTLVHGDFRLDNLCFDDDTGEVIVFDWQTIGVGPGAIDLAYFLSAAVTEDAPDGTVDEMLEFYRERLGAQGVQLSPTALKWEYEVSLLAMLHRLVPAEFQDMLDLGDGRGSELLASWIGRVMSHIEGIDPAALLASPPRD